MQTFEREAGEFASDAVSDSRNDQRHLEHERTFKSHASEHKAIRERITELALMHTNEIHELKRSIEIVQKTQGQQGEQLARVETKIELLLDRDSGHGAKR